jgi:hypothetical protein
MLLLIERVEKELASGGAVESGCRVESACEEGEEKSL